MGRLGVVRGLCRGEGREYEVVGVVGNVVIGYASLLVEVPPNVSANPAFIYNIRDLKHTSPPNSCIRQPFLFQPFQENIHALPRLQMLRSNLLPQPPSTSIFALQSNGIR